MSTTADSQLAAPDIDELLLVAVVVSAAQDAVRNASPADRPKMWAAFTAGLATARQNAPHKMPWEPADEVKKVARTGVVAAITALLREVTDKDEQLRLVKRLSEKMTAAEQEARSKAGEKAEPPGRYGRIQCARPGCGATFSPRHPSARYCSDACRQAAWKQREKTRQAAGNGRVSR